MCSPERMAGNMERVMAKERKMLSSWGKKCVPERMAGNMESVMAKERKMLSSWGKACLNTLQ